MKKKNIHILILFSLLSLISCQTGRKSKNKLDLLRKESIDRFSTNEDGITRYRIYGMENKETLILIPASNGFVEQWDPNIESLVTAGFKVITYDPFGRGLSDRLEKKMNLTVFKNQLESVIKISGSNKVTLIGSSFGSIIAANYTVENKDKVKRLVAIGPAGWPPKNTFGVKVLNIPLLGDIIFNNFGQSLLEKRVRGYFYREQDFQTIINLWNKYASIDGFFPSYLSTLRHSPVLNYETGWKKLGETQVPTQIIWGKDDISFPFENSDLAKKLIPHAQIIGVKDSAHWVNIEKAEVVNKHLLSFLKDNTN